MATHCIPRDPLFWFVVRARRVLLSACAVALVSCGGGQGEPATPVESVGPTLPAPMPAPGTTQPPPAPAQLVVGTAQSIDIGASGNPFGAVRVARSANGDGFAVWLADDSASPDDEIHISLWVNRYSAATAAWGSPFKFETSCPGGAGNFDLTVDASGNAVVAWQEMTLAADSCGEVKSARFDAGAGAWTTPMLLNADARPLGQLSVAGDANGAVLVMYVVFVNGSRGIHGRFFDPISGTWQPEAAITQISINSFSDDNRPVALLDGSGNALAVWGDLVRPGLGAVDSNYFSRSAGDWVFQLPANEGVVPGSFSIGGGVGFQLAASTGGDFLLAISAVEPGANPPAAEIRIARFTSSTRTWSAAQTLVPGNVRLQRMASDAAGNALVLWTESVGMRTALKAMRLDHAGASCSVAQVIDSAVGGGAEFADLAFDPTGHAIAVWWQFEGGRPFDGRGNIAMNHFDGATGTWGSAVFAEAEPGNAIRPFVSANGGQALLGWTQFEGGVNRVKALLQPLTNMASQ